MPNSHHHHGPAKLNYDIIIHHNHPPSYHDDSDRFNYHHTIAGYHLDAADHDHDDKQTPCGPDDDNDHNEYHDHDLAGCYDDD